MMDQVAHLGGDVEGMIRGDKLIDGVCFSLYKNEIHSATHQQTYVL